MNVEATDLDRRARVHAALGDPARLAIVDRLVLGDVSPGDVGRELQLTTNLVAHHVAVLEAAGVLRRTRSEGDRRRTYLSLVPGVLDGLVQPGHLAAPRVVFVCTRNSARSQLAAAVLASRSTVPAASAGTAPADRIHPRAVRVGRRNGLRLDGLRPAHVRDVLRAGDLVISVCDNANEHLHMAGPRLHWSVPDPAPVDTDAAFDTAFAEISGRVDRLASVLSGGNA
jgi:ArsR family transcriptional regulator, arsenate/arsenite/antimonite-responsive transcriptional repressor / arsenate reductase (thioredoxin)